MQHPHGCRTSDKSDGWTLRAVISAHVVAIFGQPIFAPEFLREIYAVADPDKLAHVLSDLD